ncbi:MAG: hypothetical protein VX438_02175, partial [Planctomycetota bacterium]|nr:hypothetical protein [Planctomycetota bacterium]
DVDALKSLQRTLRNVYQKRSRVTKTRVARDLIRASEMSSPAKPGHLVREFGQSDREQIDNSNKEPAVTQVLSLMNGFIETRIAANPNTQLMINADKSDQLESKIDTVFLSILNRYPDPNEKRIWMQEASQQGKAVAADLIWTLVNNSEFLFVQ